MAPDRGGQQADTSAFDQLLGRVDSYDQQAHPEDAASSRDLRRSTQSLDFSRRRSDASRRLAYHAGEGRNFTIRGLLVGLGVGILICFSNTFFGLQSGWVSGMTMPASLIGFSFFKTFARYLNYPFTPVENVLVQTVAGAVGTMPLGSGFVGVVPALEYLLTPAENGPLKLSLGKLVVWSLGLSFFGVVFGVPLRKQVIIREKLKFPSGTATALMIGVLHGKEEAVRVSEQDGASGMSGRDAEVATFNQRTTAAEGMDQEPLTPYNAETPLDVRGYSSWRFRIRLLVISFFISSVYTLITYFIPQLRRVPFLGTHLAREWLWTFNLSPAYLAQGIIMGPATTLHMLLGAIVGWGLLSPLAKNKGWAPGPVRDWEHGSKGWIVWISLAIMLADSMVNLGWLAGKPVLRLVPRHSVLPWKRAKWRGWKALIPVAARSHTYTAVSETEEESTLLTPSVSASQEQRSEEDLVRSRKQLEPLHEDKSQPDRDAPPEHLIGNRTVILGLAASLIFCLITIRFAFGKLVPIYATIIAMAMALLLSIMGVRALGETDINPVSGISKLTQLLFAVVIPRSNPNSVLINLVAGAVSEAGALQAGDMLQDLKTGHLLGASPKAQFYGQLIGSFVGAVASAIIYKLYTSVYSIPGELFQVPTGYVWIFTARLVTGHGLPPKAWESAMSAALLFSLTTALRICAAGTRWQSFIPGGIAVAVGMYNIPSFTLARAVGGLVHWYCISYRPRRHPHHNHNHNPQHQHQQQSETLLIILASGLILGEGIASIVNLVLASAAIPHL